MSEVIRIPNNLTPEALLPFSLILRATPFADAYILDFSGLSLTEPFGMLFLAAIIRQFVKERRSEQGKECKILVRNYEDKKYASFMGLFKSFGLDYGNDPGEASGSGTYIPLTRLPIGRLNKDARESFRQIQEIIQNEAQKIAKILTRDDKGPITETLQYAITEVMRNVVEHGNASHIWYAAQYWPSKNRVEVAVLDEGVGLLPSLKRNRKLSVSDDSEAITLALMPGISGIEKPNRAFDGEWANSGFGLYMTSSLCERAGQFLMCNYSKAISISANKKDWKDCAFNGVAIRMVINTTKIEDLNKILREIRLTVN